MEQSTTIVGLVVFMLVVSLAFFVCWLWSLIDCICRDHKGENMKLIWILVIVFVGPLGSLAYLLAGRPNTSLPGTAVVPK